MRDQRLAKQYLVELLGSITVYMVLLISSLYFGKAMQPGVARLLVLISPMLGFALMLWVLVRQYQRMDEFVRRLLLENCAIAAGITAGLTFTYGFMEGAGYPRLSMFTVWGVLGASWGLTAIVRSLLDR